MHLTLDIIQTPFNLESTVNCGQVFRWEKRNTDWYGIVGEKVIKVRQVQDGLTFQLFPEEQDTHFIKRYFRLDDDLPRIVLGINKDPTIRRAIKKFYGLRLVRQDIWECILSYICATFSNISRIKGMIRNLSQKFGKEFFYDGLVFYTFPSIDAVAKATLAELSDCRLGFRAKYVQCAARVIKDSWSDLDEMKKL
ncbi:DNA-3-methyladenine glycosylase 2 family protein, partial [Candidatus Bathyarchaeota archaeon]|nr:DNA-3-methyladenine glycosylase 2 family protein [Candidatus Bathyarchaeota archaeon]